MEVYEEYLSTFNKEFKEADQFKQEEKYCSNLWSAYSSLMPNKAVSTKLYDNLNEQAQMFKNVLNEEEKAENKSNSTDDIKIDIFLSYLYNGLNKN